ncbi:MAG: AAA family ATPase [Moorea sp. SIO3C2]|nr:AAA family ATPase [Moorena sp. SIO3C2]
MTIDQVLDILKSVEKIKLTPLQEWILHQAWEGKTYTDMAIEAHYGPEYLRKTAYKLWRLLGDIFDKTITKSNFRNTLETTPITPYHQELIEQYYRRQCLRKIAEFPSGALALPSPLYIERPPIEELCYQAIHQPGSLLRITGPKQTGKTSLLLRILDQAREKQYGKVYLNFDQAETAILSNLDRLLRWLCVNVSYQLQLPHQLDDYWDKDLGSKVSCMTYLQEHILEKIDHPLVLAMDEVHQLFEHTQTAKDFLPLLRSWHEEAKQLPVWRKLRVIVVYSTEIYVALETSQSPFNVGLPIKLPEFNKQQIQQLAQLYRLHWSNSEAADKLMAMVGGHPGLVQLALYHLAYNNISLEQLLAEAATATGIYSDYLRQHLSVIRANPDLATTLKQVVTADSAVELDPISIYKLQSMGLVTVQRNKVTLCCNLYRHYFLEHLDMLKV